MDFKKTLRDNTDMNRVTEFMTTNRKIENEEYVGNNVFFIKRGVSELADKLITGLDVPVSNAATVLYCQERLPADMGTEFVADDFAFCEGGYRYVTDGKKCMQPDFYWYITDYLDLKIFGGVDYTKPQALVKDGQIVGVCMLMDSESCFNQVRETQSAGE